MTKSLLHDPPVVPIQEFLWTIERYHRAIELGLLDENDKVELLFGKLYEKMPVGSPHSGCLTKINKYFSKRFLDSHDLRRENPVTLPNNSEPEPDFVIALAKDDFYTSGHPTPPEVLILIEVADSTLYTDRNIKLTAYASAGIREYWIVNIKSRKIELHLEPDTFEGIYANVNHYDEESTFNSPFAGETKVSDLLV